MQQKQKYLLNAYSLSTILICVSSREQFYQYFMDQIEFGISKFREKGMKTAAIESILRVTWIYLYRCPEQADQTHKRLEVISRSLFPLGKRAIYPSKALRRVFEYYICIIGGC
jgi:hypothetical protein